MFVIVYVRAIKIIAIAPNVCTGIRILRIIGYLTPVLQCTLPHLGMPLLLITSLVEESARLCKQLLLPFLWKGKEPFDYDGLTAVSTCTILSCTTFGIYQTLASTLFSLGTVTLGLSKDEHRLDQIKDVPYGFSKRGSSVKLDTGVSRILRKNPLNSRVTTK